MTKENLNNLRKILKEERFDGLLVPRADAWPGEFVSERSERLKWLSNFSGSAGTGIVLDNKAIVLTDGRYTLQVDQEIDKDLWLSGDSTKVSVSDWLIEHSKQDSVIAFDPFLHSPSEIEKWQVSLKAKSITLKPISSNPIDRLWGDQPNAPEKPVFLFSEKHAGESAKTKIKKLQNVLKLEKLDQYLFTMPDSIAWLLNIRGNDVINTPVPLCYAVLNQNGIILFIEPKQVPDDVKAAFNKIVEIKPITDMEDYLSGLNGRVGFDPDRSSYYFSDILKNKKELKDPCVDLKACKKDAEQDAIKKAHVIDGQVLLEFHRWLKDHAVDNHDELSIEAKLDEFRQKNAAYHSRSFNTITGYGPNGAVIHYRSSKKTSHKIEEGGLLLIDSGGQYFSEECAGTTDVTRTYIIGEASNEQKLHYSLVLKAHITIANAKFPYGTTGAQIDALARAVLWQEGFDFAHGLGHGVGCFLNVHEEASNLSPRGQDTLEPGMLLSNEPGLYFEGQYGIRIENLMFVQKTGEQDILGRDMLCFETVTLAPYDNDLIDFNLLNGAEMKWLQSYYTKVEEHLEI